MNIYCTDKEVIAKLQEEVKRRKRSLSYIVREKLRKAYGLGNGGD